jgi:hypothetical protein
MYHAGMPALQDKRSPADGAADAKSGRAGDVGNDLVKLQDPFLVSSFCMF